MRYIFTYLLVLMCLLAQSQDTTNWLNGSVRTLSDSTVIVNKLEAVESIDINSGSKYPYFNWTVNIDGTIDVGETVVSLYDNPNGSGNPKKYIIPAITNQLLTDGVNNYIYADYNFGNPIYKVTTSKEDINSSDKIPIVTANRNGDDTHAFGWPGFSTNPVGKLLEAFSRLDRFRLFTGLAPSGNASREIQITEGVVYAANINNVLLPAFDSSIDDMDIYIWNGSSWDNIDTNVYVNDVYQGATGLTALSNPNKFVAIYGYTLMDENNPHVVYILSTDEFNSASEAFAADTPGNKPPIISAISYPSFIIAVQKNLVALDENIRSPEDNKSSSPTTVHNDLSGLQGGLADERYHLSSEEYNLRTTYDTIMVDEAEELVVVQGPISYVKVKTFNFSITNPGFYTVHSSVDHNSRSGSYFLNTMITIDDTDTVGGEWEISGFPYQSCSSVDTVYLDTGAHTIDLQGEASLGDGEVKNFRVNLKNYR